MSTKKKTKKKTSTQDSSWASTATLQSMLRFGPQESVLRQATNTAQQNYRSALDAARTYALLTGNAAKQAMAPTKERYDQAAARQKGIGDTVSASLQGLSGPGIDVMKAAMIGGQADYASGLESARARELQGLEDAQVSAKAGEQAAGFQANQQLISDLTKILTERQDLASQKGTFEALTVDQLRKEAADAAAKVTAAATSAANARGNAYISAGLTPDGAAPLPGKGPKPGTVSATGIKLVNPNDHRKAKALYGSILSRLQADPPPKFNKDGSRRTDKQIMQALVNGKPEKRDAKGKILSAATPGIEDPLLVAAAVEVAKHGRISKATQRELANAGFSIKQLGLTTDAQFKKRKAARRKKAPLSSAAREAANAITFGR